MESERDSSFWHGFRQGVALASVVGGLTLAVLGVVLSAWYLSAWALVVLVLGAATYAQESAR